MTSERPPASDKPPADKRAEREAKLAEALRKNLRRRKTEPKSAPPKPGDGESA
jgi:hypothetical protein